MHSSHLHKVNPVFYCLWRDRKVVSVAEGNVLLTSPETAMKALGSCVCSRVVAESMSHPATGTDDGGM